MENISLICPYYLHREALERFSEAKVNFFAPDDLLKAFGWSYGPEAIYEAFIGEGEKNFELASLYVRGASELLETGKGSADPKMQKIRSIKARLLQKGLLKKDSLLARSLRKGKIVLFGLEEEGGLKRLLQDQGISFEEVSPERKPLRLKLKRYRELKEEGEEALSKIGVLLKAGVPASEIGMAIESEYQPFLASLAALGGLKLTLSEEKVSLTPYFQKTIATLKEQGWSESLLAAEAEDGYGGAVVAFLKEAMGEITEQRIRADKDFLIGYLNDRASKASLPSGEGIKMTADLADVFLKKHVFFLGFDDTYPVSVKDSGFLTDQEIAAFTSGETSYERNGQSRNDLLRILARHEDLTLSCSRFDPITGAMGNSPLTVEDEKDYKNPYEEILSEPANEKPVSMERFSPEGDKLVYGSELNDYTYYGEDSPEFRVLQKGFKDFKAYKPANEEVSFPTSGMELKFSFTNIKDYAACPYSFLLKWIYKFPDEWGEDLMPNEGLVVHKVFEEGLKLASQTRFDLSIAAPEEDSASPQPSCLAALESRKAEVKKEFLARLPDFSSILQACRIEGSKLSQKDSFYLTKVYTFAKEAVYQLIIFQRASQLNEAETEKPFISKENGREVKGRIDAIISNPSGYFLLDYKTGKHNFDLNDALNGLDAQLPFYASVLAVSPEYETKKLWGMYFVQPFASDLIYSFDYDLGFSGIAAADQKGERLVVGQSVEPDEVKGVIKARSKFWLMDEALFLKTVQDKIESFYRGIQEGQFPVKQKKYLKDNGETERVLCQFCPYKDCCYVDGDEAEQSEILPVLKENSCGVHVVDEEGKE
jgi:RecB family exonuclease